jgi:capsular polysaccharide biosynthesis protein
MKNKTVIVILVALAVIVGVLYNVVTIVDTYDEYKALKFWDRDGTTARVFTEYNAALEYSDGFQSMVTRRKVILKQRLLTGQTWREYLYDN